MMCLASFLFAAAITSYFVIKEKDLRYTALLLFLLAGFLLAGYSAAQGETKGLAGKAVSGEGIVLESGMTSGGNQKLTIACDLEDETGQRWRN